MTDEKKIEQVCDWLDEDAHLCAELMGGYPDIAVVVESSIVVAGYDEANGQQLDVYCKEYILAWHKAIRHSMRCEPDEDIRFHLWENTPPGDTEHYSA